MDKPCKCGGMNEDCQFCGGTGLVEEKKIEIIKTVADKSEIKKQNSDLESYLHAKPEKMYISNKKSLPRKKKNPVIKTLKELTDEDHLKFIGPNNPNKSKFRGTIKFIKKKNATTNKLIAREKEVNAKVENGAELEFLLFWKNNIKRKTKGNKEFQECLLLFLTLKEGKREKFKHGLAKRNTSKQADIRIMAQEIFDKLAR